MQKAELIEMEIRNFILHWSHQNEQEAEAKGRGTVTHNMYECVRVFMDEVFED